MLSQMHQSYGRPHRLEHTFLAKEEVVDDVEIMYILSSKNPTGCQKTKNAFHQKSSQKRLQPSILG